MSGDDEADDDGDGGGVARGPTATAPHRNAFPSLSASADLTRWTPPAFPPQGRVAGADRAVELHGDSVHVVPLTFDERLVQLKVLGVVFAFIAASFAMTCVGIPLALAIAGFFYFLYNRTKQEALAEAGRRFVIQRDGAHVFVDGDRATPWPLKRITSSYVRKRKPSGKVKTSFQLVLKLHDGTKERVNFMTDSGLDDAVALFQRAGIEVKLHRLY